MAYITSLPIQITNFTSIRNTEKKNNNPSNIKKALLNNILIQMIKNL